MRGTAQTPTTAMVSTSPDALSHATLWLINPNFPSLLSLLALLFPGSPSLLFIQPCCLAPSALDI